MTVESDPLVKKYRKLVIRNGRVIGAILVGDTSQAGVFTEMPCTRIDVRNVRDLLLKDSFDFDKLVDALLVKSLSVGAN